MIELMMFFFGFVAGVMATIRVLARLEVNGWRIYREGYQEQHDQHGR